MLQALMRTLPHQLKVNLGVPEEKQVVDEVLNNIL